MRLRWRAVQGGSALGCVPGVGWRKGIPSVQSRLTPRGETLLMRVA